MEATLMENVEEQMRKALYDEANGQTVKMMESLEKSTGWKREDLTRSGAGLVALYLIFGYAAELVCNAIGFVYPAYASIQAIESPGTEDDTQWLTYWTVFALFSLVDFASEIFMGWLPLYWLAKCIILLWLWNPLTRGAELVFKTYVLPLLDRYQPLQTGPRTPSPNPDDYLPPPQSQGEGLPPPQQPVEGQSLQQPPPPLPP